MTYYQISRSELLGLVLSAALMLVAMISGTFWCIFYAAGNSYVSTVIVFISEASGIVGAMLFVFICLLTFIIISEHEPKEPTP